MLLSAVSVLVVAQSSSEIPEGLTNNPVLIVILITTLAYCAFTHLPITQNLKTVYFPKCEQARRPPPISRAHGGGGAFIFSKRLKAGIISHFKPNQNLLRILSYIP